MHQIMSYMRRLYLCALKKFAGNVEIREYSYTPGVESYFAGVYAAHLPAWRWK